jgi:hypothetical protein
MSTKSESKQNVIGRMQRLATGLRQHLSGQLLLLAGKSVKADDLVSQLDGYVAQLAATFASEATWHAQVLATRTMEDSQINPQVSALETYLLSLYGPTSPTLSDFGLTPRKARARTVKSKAEALDKSAATRVARHTLGPRQKASIHGAVPPESSPPAASSPPSSPTSPDAPKRNS